MGYLKSLLQRITSRGRCISELQQKDLSSDSRGRIGRITLKGDADMQQQLQVPDPPGCGEPVDLCYSIGAVSTELEQISPENWQKFFAV